jgi:hypothetical protein
MGYPALQRQVAFATVLETTPGTVGSPTMAANAIRLLEPPTIEEFYLAENLTDDIVTGKLGVLTLAAPGARAFRIRGRAPIVGRGVAYADTVAGRPELDPLIVAGGFARTVTTTAGSEKVDYNPSDDPNAGANSTVTAVLEAEGKKYTLSYGVLEELSIMIEAATFPIFSFTLVGIATDPTEQALEAATYGTTLFPVWKGAGSFALSGATTIKPRSFELSLGLAAAPRVDANAVDGHSGYRITGRVPEVRLRAETQALTDWNPRQDFNLRTIDVSCGLSLVSPQYKRFKIDIDDARVVGVDPGEENRLSYHDVRYRVSMPASGSECKLSFD